MKNVLYYLLVIVLFFSCQRDKEISSINLENWEKRKAGVSQSDSLIHGKTYLPVYSQIYQLHEHRTYDLTVTASLRNVSMKDTVYILSAEYYNTDGEKLRDYLKYPIYLEPMATVEIVIDEVDQEGGTGGNFIFDWMVEDEKNLPLFEAVMISTTGQQGLSFLTRGVRIYD